MFYSPLRYPGGKNKLSAFIAKICIDNNIKRHYIEPYAGGASVALFLLFENFVKKITINDKDKSIYAFWYSVLNYTDQLCELIEKTDINIDEWKKQKKIQKIKEKANILELGFSTIFLNRTNRSGIINAGVIGGIKQKGKYKIDCRFNKKEIIRRIKLIASRKDDIRLFNLDALELIEVIKNERNSQQSLFYFDPPYYLKGSSLYMNNYNESEQEIISERIKSIKNVKWIVSYDNVKEIKELYKKYPSKEFSFKHTAYIVREGKEIIFLTNNIKQPEIENWNPLGFKYIKRKTTANIVYKALGDK